MRELTNEIRLGIQDGELKKEELKQKAFQKEERAAALDSMRNPMCFSSTKACKPILVVTQNKTMNLKMATIRLL